MPAKLQYFDARTCASADVIRAIRDDGACVVTNLITAAEADAIVAEMRPYIERTTKGNDNFAGLNTTRTGALAARSPTFNRGVLLNRIFLDAADDVLLPWCKRYQVRGDTGHSYRGGRWLRRTG
jgi:ectoine hydroxylase-related dioxygenase (phytanoyl-CoA dioxygenase family)